MNPKVWLNTAPDNTRMIELLLTRGILAHMESTPYCRLTQGLVLQRMEQAMLRNKLKENKRIKSSSSVKKSHKVFAESNSLVDVIRDMRYI